MTAAMPTTPADDPGPSVANLDTIVSLCKRRGFIFPSCEIYGGINAFWDYGPLGVELKNNVKAPGGRPWSRSATTSSASTPHHHGAPGLGGLRPRRRLHRPAGGLHDLQAAASALDHCRASRRQHGMDPRSSTPRPQVPGDAAR